MPRNTSVILGEHFNSFIESKVEQGRFESASEAVRAGLRLLEADEAKLDLLRAKLTKGKAQADSGETVDGETFMQNLMNKDG